LGDGSPAQPLAYDAQHHFVLSNVYNQEGTYTVTVRANDQVGNSGLVSFFVHVFTARPSDPARVTAAPGTTVDTSVGNITVELTRSATATDEGSLVVAQLPVNPAPAAGSLALSTSNGQGGQTTIAKFDIRSINLSDNDSATVTFDVYSPNGSPPVLTMVDPTTGLPVPVIGSQNVANSLSVTFVPFDPANPPADPSLANKFHYKVRIVFDGTSTPTLPNLKGTVFTLVVPRNVPEGQPIQQNNLLLASNGNSSAAAGQTQFEVSFSRGAITSGSETTVATVASQASQAVFSVGADISGGNTAFIRDMLFDSYRAFGDNPDTVPGGQPPAGNRPWSGGDQVQARTVDPLFAAAAAGTPLVSLAHKVPMPRAIAERLQRAGEDTVYPDAGFSSEYPSPRLLSAIGGTALALLMTAAPRLATNADFEVIMPGFEKEAARSSKRRGGFWRWLLRKIIWA
jgi:hypothetical protein